LIFVLAGQENRKQYALELLRQGISSRVLFSVSRFEIRRFSSLPLPKSVDLLKLASPVPPPRRHFFVLFETDDVHVDYVCPGRFGTLTEIEALQRWLADRPAIRSVLLISSRLHLARVQICCRALFPQNLNVTLTPVPETAPPRFSFWSAALLETFKTCIYLAVLVLHRHPKP